MSISLYSQSQLHVFQDWVSNAGSQNFLIKSRTITDASKNVYVVGATLNGSGNYDILVAKYDSKGVQQWINQYNGAGNGHDVGAGIDVDAVGNVYITGTVTTATSVDLIVIRYNSSGVQLWLQTYNGTGNFYDAGADVKLVTGTNFGVYVTGSSYNASGNTDFLTIKYSPSGVFQWANVYDHSTNMNDAAVKVVIRPTQVVVTGAVQTATSTYRCAIVRYNPLTGLQIGAVATSSTTTNITEVNDMFIDASDNIYITGTGVIAGQGNNYITLKFNSSLVSIWEEIYNGASNLDDVAKGIQVDGSGNVFVTGYTTTTTEGRNWATIKYNTGGTQQWVQFYNDTLNADDEANGIALDNFGNAYVTGYTTTALNQKDFYTIKYNSSGTLIWEIGTDGAKHLNDISSNIVIDNAGDIVIAGQSETAPSVYEYLTVKYVEKDVITPTDFNGESPQNSFLYFENRGQLFGTDTALVPNIKYYTLSSSPSLYFTSKSVSMVFKHVDTVATDTMHRIDISFPQANSYANTYSMEKQPEYLNYFLAHCPQGVTEVNGNRRLVTTNLFPNIDVEYYSNNRGLKYYFIVKPGGNPADINLEFTGASSFNLDGTTNVLTINSSIGSIAFDRPTVYQLNSSNVIVPVTGWTADWQTNGASNKYKFNIGSYNTAETLVIEVDRGDAVPTILHINSPEWSTYFGGDGYDEGTDVSIDTDGNPYFTGFTNSTAYFPVVAGSSIYANAIGNFDAYVSKFGSANGASSGVVPLADKLLWTSFYGGTGDDRAYSITTTGNGTSGKFYITGFTKSTDIVTENGSGLYEQNTISGAQDAFIVSMDNSTGGFSSSNRWISYFGGVGNEIGYSIATKSTGEIYMAGSTSTATYSSTSCSPPADSGFPKCNTSSTFDNGGTYGGGQSDGFICGFNTGGTLQWSSFYGGADIDTINEISFDSSDKLYLTGETGSSSGFPILAFTGGYNQSAFGTGTTDAFISRFTSGLVHDWCTYFGGDGNEAGLSLISDSNDNIYMAGKTSSTTPACTTSCTCVVPATGEFPLCKPAGSYFQGTGSLGVYGGGTNDGFIAKFNSSSVFTWGTYYGGIASDRINDLGIDYLDRVFFTGHTYSSGPSSNLYLNGPAGWYWIQGFMNGTNDAFLGFFDASNVRIWSDYYGNGSNDDKSNSIAVYSTASNNEHWYITGATNSLDFHFVTNASTGECCPNAYGNPWYVDFGDAYNARFSITGHYMAGILDKPLAELNANVYPNPASDYINVNFNIAGTEKVSIMVYNVSGQIIDNFDYGKQSGNFFRALDFSNYNSGFYFIQIRSDKNVVTKKVIKYN